MSTATFDRTDTTHQSAATRGPRRRALVLADRLERGAYSLAALASGLSEAQWKTVVPGDGRTVGVVVHHVASVYPVEIDLAQKIAAGHPIVGVTMNDIHVMNAGHARDNANVTQQEAIELLRRNSTAAAEAIRALADEDLDRAVVASLYDDAPITCQFMLEDHAVRHSYHHLAVITRALSRDGR